MAQGLLVQQLRLALKPPCESEGTEGGSEDDEKRLHGIDGDGSGVDGDDEGGDGFSGALLPRKSSMMSLSM